MSAPNIGMAPLPQRARRFWGTRFSTVREALEGFLERERGQLPPWFVVGLGTGITAWFALGQPRDWAAFLFFPPDWRWRGSRSGAAAPSGRPAGSAWR